MKRIILHMFIFAILGTLMVKLINMRMTDIRKEYESKLGSIVVIGNDTTFVTNYSTLNETFSLSNGMTVDKSIVIKKP